MTQKPILKLARDPEEIRAAIASVEAAVADIREGRMVILVDDADRENEGDLCIAAEKVTPEAINFMAKYGRGLICLSLTEEQLDRLNLGMMVPDWENTSGFGTAFTVSIEARRGVTTGISAADRATTVLTAIHRSPSFSRSAPSTRTAILPSRISPAPASTEAIAARISSGSRASLRMGFWVMRGPPPVRTAAGSGGRARGVEVGESTVSTAKMGVKRAPIAARRGGAARGRLPAGAPALEDRSMT